MRRTITISAVVAVTILALYALAQSAPAWKVFTNRAGWSMSYPANWSIASCHSCKDPKAPDVFVDFFPPQMKTSEGWVMVSPLANRPPNTSVDAWLADISNGANLNPHIQEQKVTLNTLPALKVRYLTADHQQMEEVYVVSGSETFSISFNVDPGRVDVTNEQQGVPLEKFNNYATYLKMLDTFRVTSR